MKRTAVLTLAALTGAASVVNAQVSTFTYTGEVVEISDELGVFGDAFVGSDGFGGFTLDLDASVFDTPMGDFSGLFEALAANAALGDIDISGVTSPEAPFLAIVEDDVWEWVDGVGVYFDVLTISMPVGSTADYDFGYVDVKLVGTSDWFAGSGSLPDPLSMGFENLLSAEVVIEFSQLRGSGGGDGSPGDGDGDGQYELFQSRAVMNILTIDNPDGTVATIGCRSYQFADPVATFDIFDLFAFVDEYTLQSSAADMNHDGVLNVFDIFTFLGQAETGCAN